MKRLDAILSRSRNGAISADPSVNSSAIAEDEEGRCTRCKGAGFVRVERPRDHPRFGKAELCDCVRNEAEGERRERLERISHLGSFSRFTFETLVPCGRHGDEAAFRSAFEVARRYAAEPEGWLVLTGPSGAGKTHLAAAIANERVALGQPALFVVVPDLLDRLRSGYDPAEDELDYDRLFEQVRTAPLLLLDGIDTAAPTPWAKEKLFQLLNARYNTALPTVFTSTLRPGLLDDRLVTRLCDEALSRVVTVGGERRAQYHPVGGMTRDRLEQFRFDNFDLKGVGLGAEERESLRAGFNVALRYAEEPSGWLVLQGGQGCGKTHLAAAVANRVLRDGGTVCFAVVPELLDHLRRVFGPNNDGSGDELFEIVRSVDLLVLDDLGAQSSTAWAQEKLFQVVNFRTTAGKPSVVTTDLPLDELNAVYPRLVSRIADPAGGTQVYILAPHYRLGRLLERVAPQRRSAYSTKR